MRRYERKMRTYLYGVDELVALIKSSRVCFQERYPSRIVNSIYLDTSSRSFAQDNLAGISSRIKPRIRWYGAHDNIVSDGRLELKCKRNLLGWKDTYPFGSLSTTKTEFGEQFKERLRVLTREHHQLDFLEELEPCLMTKYERQYFVSADRVFRITIDSNIEYWPFSRFGPKARNSHKEYDLVIFELKYDENSQGINEVLKDFPFRFARSSKYVTGVLST
jgi:SPX domain protein involved in polyphosphate accumulation